MNLISLLITALEMTGGERVILHQGELPHLVVDDRRVDIGTGKVMTISGLELLAAQILSPEGKRVLAERDIVVEPVPDDLATIPLVFVVRRLGDDLCIELRRSDSLPETPTEPGQPSTGPEAPVDSGSSSDEPRASTPAVVETPKDASGQPLEDPEPEPPAAQDAIAPEVANAEGDSVPDARTEILEFEPSPETDTPEERTPIETAFVPATSAAAPITDPEPAPPAVVGEQAGTDPEPTAPVETGAPEGYSPGEPSQMAMVPQVAEPAEPGVGQPQDLSEEFVPALHSVEPEGAAPEHLESIPADDRRMVLPPEGPAQATAPPREVEEVELQSILAPLAVAVELLIEPVPDEETAVTTTMSPRSPPRGDTSALEYWVRLAARREASTLYLRTGDAPVVCCDERLEPLTDGLVDESALDAVAAAVAAGEGTWRPGPPIEWCRDYDGIGVVRCCPFADKRGRGLVVHLPNRNSVFPLQKYIPQHVRRICAEEDGVVLVAAPSAAAVLEMVVAVVDWAAQRRGGYVVCIEPPNGVSDAIRGAFVSVRQAARTDQEVAVAVRQAALEGPDVLALTLPSAAAGEEAVLTVGPGRLVLIGLVASTTTRALQDLVTVGRSQRDGEMRRLLAEWFRCGFSYRALRRIGGGLTVAQDLLVANPDVRARLEQGDFSALERLQRSGTLGMQSLEAGLAAAVLRREVSLRYAAAQATDRRELMRLIREACRGRAR